LLRRLSAIELAHTKQKRHAEPVQVIPEAVARGTLAALCESQKQSALTAAPLAVYACALVDEM
jgi:hypothetical protein